MILKNNNQLHKNYYSSNINLLLVLVAILIAAAYRIHGIDRLGLWADELWGVLACSRGSWMAMMHELIMLDNHPPAYQTILYFVMKWFGDTEIIVRMPSVIAGIATVLAVYYIGKKLLSDEIGIVAAFIVAGSYQLIFYSQEARAYTLLALFCTINVYYFLELFIIENTKNKNILLYAASGVICAYLHYAGLLFICCELLLAAILIVFGKNKKDMFVAILYAYGVIALLYIKWVPVILIQMHHDEFYWEETPDMFSIFRTFKYLLGPDDFRALFYAITILAALFFSCRKLIKNYSDPDNKHRIILAIFILILVPLVVVLIESLLYSSIYTNRYFVFVIPLASLIGAHGIIIGMELLTRKNIKRSGLMLPLIFICVTGFLFNRDLYAESFGKQDFRGATAIIAGDAEFVSEHGWVIASHEFFDYYLKKFNIAEHAWGYLLFPDQLQSISKKINRSGTTFFYYLEVSLTEQTPINHQLDSSYQRVSYQRLNGINVIKYKIRDI